MSTWQSIVVKIVEVFGIVGVVLTFLIGGVPRIVARVLPIVLALVDKIIAWLFMHQAIKSAVIANKDKIKALLNAIAAGIQQIIDAAEKEAEKDIDAAS